MAKMKFVAIWISLACILIFILQMIFPITQYLYLSQQNPLEVWRFLTSIFIHSTTSHLAYNLFALLFFGLILEKMTGSLRFFLIFIITGIVANIFAINFYSASLGASGAIFGVIGFLTIIRPKLTVWAFGIPMPLFIASFVWIVGNSLGVLFPSNVGNIAHLSGVAIGMLMGLIFRGNYFEPKIEKRKIRIPEDYMRVWEDSYLR